MKTCQIILLCSALLQFTLNLYVDINGRKARTPGGFSGAIASCFALIIQILVLYIAGAFSTLIP